MIQPPLLKPGDVIGIIAPARKVAESQIHDAIQKFESWGFKVRLSENIYNNSHSYLSGTDSERLADFQKMILDEDVKAIICARGGYGSTKIIDAIDFSSLQKRPKWIVGFSDITAIHLKLFALGIKSIHSSMPILFSKYDSKSSIESLKSILATGNTLIECEAQSHNRYGESSEIIVGGNLSLIVDSLATPSEINTDGKILLIEEIDEYFYKVDRMLTQLKRAGKLKNLKGLIVGHMTDIKESELKFGLSIEGIVLNVVSDFSFPVAFGFPSGHENPNLAWVHGDVVTLSVGIDKTVLSSRALV
jgi:muramoyltetrapeptide carboxypeptidase